MKKKDETSFYIMLVALIAVSVIVAACARTPPSTPWSPNGGGSGGGNVQLSQGTFTAVENFDPKASLPTKNFATEEEYLTFVKANSNSNSYGYYGSPMMYKNSMGVALDSAAAPRAAMAESVSGGSASQDYSTTNNQVANVDEADIIKNDGEYIYTISGTTVFILKAYPGEDAKVISTIKFKERPTSLFITKDYLAVFGNFHDLDFFKEIDFRPRQGLTFFNIYSLKDKENPELVKEYKFEGNYFQARMTGDYVYFVTTTGAEVRKDYPTPIMIEGTTISRMPIRDMYYFPIPYQSVQFANIHAINLDNPDNNINSKSVAVESSQNMYMSEDSIFITYTEYINEYQLMQKITVDLMQDELTESDKELIAKIKLVDDDVMSRQEKESKILQIIESYISFLTEDERTALQDDIDTALQEKLKEYEYLEYTVINKISISNGEIRASANGKVPGHVNNQFSMDEQDDVLRIATTISQRWSYLKEDSEQETQSTNNVFTLDKDLKILDSLKGLAKGEQIYSTRFIGDRLYMVTYRQVDPFFVIDLKDPTNIKEMGRLKIPGFSKYLHPYDANTIIGIGRDATSTGQTRGLKISLFDVSDVENPKEVAKFVMAERYSQSNAEYEHKAFLFSKDKELLVIPAYSYDYTWYEGGVANKGTGYNGAMVFKITKSSIEMRGLIDHSKGTGRYYQPSVERSLYIDDMLYTKSEGLLRINKLSDLTGVKNIELAGGDSPYPVY